MKFAMTSLMVLLFSQTSFAYEIYTAGATIPADVQTTVRAAIKRECPIMENSIRSLDLESYQVVRTRIDQGYVEDNYKLDFVVYFNNDNRAAESLEINVVKEIEDRSGNLKVYVNNLTSKACR
ncbi:MAG: hypothetical protein AB7I27_14425 [Bacteriovoracaceae bacterium]